LLIRDKEVGEIASELIKTKRWEEVTLVKKFKEDHLQPPPRVFKLSDETFSIELWTEKAMGLTVDHNAVIETPDCEAFNTVLVESEMHPPEAVSSLPQLITAPDRRIKPNVPCQSATRHPRTKIYIPAIWSYIAALLRQIKYLNDNSLDKVDGYGPRSDVSLLIRYLFLENPTQRTKVLPKLDKEARAQLEEILDNYKRTQKFRPPPPGPTSR